ncbi:uncharacterized protein PRCAT00000516001 [Priceomyces carsonii]|uniref:uncharacterized protein n=1 Tax=Priceomyces carsonii TaxID=28549 RepID=UPI002ED8B4A9|nr:unnamed protein product [Priceomyces carsonii]
MLISKTTIQLGNFSRRLSIISKFKPSSKNDISRDVSDSNKPTGTGRGPFIELPHFKPLGSPSNLLSVTLPQHSRLNIREGSIVAVNGNIDGLATNRKSLTTHTPYRELLSESSVSLVISGQKYNYSMISIDKKDEEWLILDDQNIIAWTGFNFELSPVSLYKRFKSFQTKGKGVIVVNGSNQLFDITLDLEEELLLNPTSLIATNSRPELEILQTKGFFRRIFLLPEGSMHSFISRIRSVELPKLSLPVPRRFLDRLSKHLASWSPKEYNYPEALKKTKPIFIFMGSLISWARLRIVNRLAHHSAVFLKIKGPAKLLVHNSRAVPNQKFFTEQEIEAIFSSKGKL